MVLINPFIIKEIFNNYSDTSSFTNYEKICRDYYKLYFKLLKKLKSISKDKLCEEVKEWLFKQSLENRIKICTVENELFCQIIYQMYLYTDLDNSYKFCPKSELTEIFEIKKTLTLNGFNENTEFDFEFTKYFNCCSSSGIGAEYNLLKGTIYGEEENDKHYNSNIDEILSQIKFYSVHHKPYPDCFCLSPYFLLKEETFKSTFYYMGNTNYFTSFIEPYYDSEKKIYGYKLPDWFGNCSPFTITQYIFAFIEQAIMIKFLLNNYFIYNNNTRKNNINKDNTSIFSLVNEENLSRIFIDRKTVINYLNINYNDINSKRQLVEDSNIEFILSKILKNNKIMEKISYFINFKNYNNYNFCSNSPLFGFNNKNKHNIYNTLYDDIHSFINYDKTEQNKLIVSKIRIKILDILERSDNIIFVDFLLFQNFKNIWILEYFIFFEIIEYIINLFNEQNCNELLIKSKKKNKRKKKKKNNNKETNNNNDNNIINDNKNNNNNNDINKQENQNKVYNIELECYNELFKDKEKLLYIPYYFSVNIDLKNKYNKIKEKKLKNIEKNNKKQKIKEIYNYIKNEFLLKYIIDKVIHLQPDNYVSFFDNENKDKINEIIEKDTKKISGLKLRKTKKSNNFMNDDIFGIININLNIKKLDTNIIEEKTTDNDNKLDNHIIDDDKLNKKNNIFNKENKTRINSKDKKNKNKYSITKEEKNDNYNNNDNNNINKENNIIIDTIEIANKNNSDNKIDNNNNNKNNHKKKQKSPNMFFLFDTVKNKNKKKNKSKSPIKTESKDGDHFELSFISSRIKSSKISQDLSFMEKLHNNILNNEKKVNNILQLLTEYKNYAIDIIKKIIKDTYDNNLNNYSIDLYGSFVTGLMIEASDIDIRIKINECQKDVFEKYFFSLSDKLEAEKKFEKITPISTASVPVIKLVINIEKFINNQKDLEKDFNKFKQMTIFKNYLFDKNELLQIKIDITFIVNYIKENINDNSINNQEIINKTQNDKMNISPINNDKNNNSNELSSVSYIKEQLEIYPEIKPILKLLKRYFYMKKMNFSFEGGLSSYNLFLLILSFVKYQNLYNFNNINKINLGYFLVQFLEFFGKIFDFKNYLININSPYIYLNNYNNYNCGKTLIILDPLTGLNASKSSYKIGEIQKMFLNAFNYFEKEKINYESEIYKKESNDKRNNDKKNNFEVVLGLTKVHKNDYIKKNKMNTNIIDKFFFT